MSASESVWLPAADLRPWVDFHIQYSTPDTAGQLTTHLPPSATASLTLMLKGGVSLLEAATHRPRALTRVFFSGARTQPARLISADAFSCLVVVFTPGRWHSLVDVPALSLLNRHLDAHSLASGRLLPLAEQLAAAPASQRQPLLEQALRHWLQHASGEAPSGIFSPLDSGWMRDALLHKPPGQMARDYGLSLRQIERRFAQQFGLTPKAYQRLARHALLLAHLGQTAEAGDLAALASKLGYADQAHLSRDLKHFTGMQPGKMPHLALQNPGYWAYRVLPQALAEGAGMSRFFKP